MILLLITFIIYICILAVFFGQGKLKNNIIFGVSLPEQAQNDNAIKQLQAEYKKAYTVYGVLILFTLIPYFLLADYFSLSFIYTFIWVIAIIYTSKLPFLKFHHKAAALKREKQWFVGEKRIIDITSKIAKLKDSKIIAPYWFLIPALISLVPIILSFQNDNLLMKMTGYASLAMTVILYTIYSVFAKMKPKTYSKNDDINAALNGRSKRYWSILWIGMAIFESLNAIVAYTILTQGNSSSFTYWIIGIIMVSLVPLGSIFFVHNKVRALEESLADTDGKAIVSDDDAWWIDGFTYHNPNDTSIKVAKRRGIGTTFNMATPAGRSMQNGSITIVLLLVILTGFLTIQSDITAPNLLIEETGIITIDYPRYDYSFSIEDIEEIKLEDTIPSGFRSNGIATSKYARGNFSMEKLGATKLYIFKNSPPYLFIKLEDKYVIYNDKDPIVTKALYNKLLEMKAD